MHISSLITYPVKSGRGITLQTAEISAKGLPFDRIAMLVMPDGRFITQRELPRLAQLAVAFTDSGLSLAMGDRTLALDLPLSSPSRATVTIWNDVVDAACADEEINDQLSGWFGQTLKLVVLDDRSQRFASADWAEGRTPVTFADGFQVLVTTTASLKALNEDMVKHDEEAISMDRFRPNIVIDCEEPWAEDRWSRIRIGDVEFDLVKPCARCIMTTQDQQSGSREVPNPMPAMGRLRFSLDRRVPGPVFGWNAVPRGIGTIASGDVVTVMEERLEKLDLKRR